MICNFTMPNGLKLSLGFDPTSLFNKLVNKFIRKHPCLSIAMDWEFCQIAYGWATFFRNGRIFGMDLVYERSLLCRDFKVN